MRDENYTNPPIFKELGGGVLAVIGSQIPIFLYENVMKNEYAQSIQSFGRTKGLLK